MVRLKLSFCRRSFQNSSAQPLVKMLADELVVVEVRVIATDALDFLGLTGGKRFAWVETPGAFEQALPPEDFVNSRNAAGKTVRCVKQRRVAVGDLRRQREHVGGHV